MLDWLKRRLASSPEVALVDPDEAMAMLRQVVSDAAFEEVWEAMDHHPDDVEREVRAALAAGELGEYPRHAALIWLGSTLGNSRRTIEAEFVDKLVTSIGWALGFDENVVLLGGALSALDALGSRREEAALRLFAEAGVAKPRRYWLLLKVRTDAMMERVVDALSEFEVAPAEGDPSDEDFVYSPTAANRMAGAFRQFQSADFDLVARYFDLENAGAVFLVEALGATGQREALPMLRRAAADERADVRRTAERWIRLIE